MHERDLTKLLRIDEEIVTASLDRWATVAGDRPFFHYGEDRRTLTFSEFATRTDAIAGNLAANGVGKGDRVSVFSGNPLTSALMMFGIWKAGAVYCPVNFAYAGRLLSYQLNDTSPKLVVTDSKRVTALNEVVESLDEPPVVVVYQPPQDAHDYSSEAAPVHATFREIAWATLTANAASPGIHVSFDDPANLIYTSGTTGPAKGVLQPYRWMAQYTFYLRMLTTPDDVIYSDLPMYHVGGAIANVCRAAWVGCEVAVWNRFSPDNFWSRVKSRGATTAILLDVMIPRLTGAPQRADDRSNTLNKVHMQPMSLLHAEFTQRFGIDFVTAGFGQTEAGLALWSVIEECAQGEGTSDELYRGLSHGRIAEVANQFGMFILRGKTLTRKSLMGRPTPFVDATIRNERDEECRPGEVGQLCLRSKLPGLFMHSYFGKPEATEQAFRNLWLHTGDAAVQDADGWFYFVDRLGDRIRVRGENLSSFQVEDMLVQHAAVQLCAVVGIPCDEGEEDEVVAYIVPADGQSLTEAAVHDFALQTMPKYMRPRHVRIVEDLPRTPTNKVEKFKLRQRILAELGRLMKGVR
ncbi:crotonobetaine/carnitine-CoA ligase [Burkholderia sp. GAS332]|nr:crotonobetaine/carnitine-CoA ligase [Burkholderia sp. GAS332]